MGIRAEEFEEIMFADDLNAFQELEAAVNDENAFERTRAVQRSLHHWGEANRDAARPVLILSFLASDTIPNF